MARKAILNAFSHGNYSLGVKKFDLYNYDNKCHDDHVFIDYSMNMYLSIPMNLVLWTTTVFDEIILPFH